MLAFPLSTWPDYSEPKRTIERRKGREMSLVIDGELITA
jgi:hypothetical protein